MHFLLTHLCLPLFVMCLLRMDKFLVEDSGVGGMVVGIRVRLTSSPISPDWFLRHVMVQDLESGLSSGYTNTKK